MEKLEQEKKVKHQLFQSMVGCVPKCEGQLGSGTFGMDSWGESAVVMAGNTSKATSKKIEKKLSDVVRGGGEGGVGRTMSFVHALSTRTLHGIIARGIGIALRLAKFAWEGGRLEDGGMPETGFEYVGTSGEVKTGQGVSFQVDIRWAGVPHRLQQCLE
jgi:hypothetical protein